MLWLSIRMTAALSFRTCIGLSPFFKPKILIERLQLNDLPIQFPFLVEVIYFTEILVEACYWFFRVISPGMAASFHFIFHFQYSSLCFLFTRCDITFLRLLRFVLNVFLHDVPYELWYLQFVIGCIELSLLFLHSLHLFTFVILGSEYDAFSVFCLFNWLILATSIDS